MGVAYALRPSEARLALMRPLSLASLFAALAGFASGLINGLMFHCNCENDQLPALEAILARIEHEFAPLLERVEWVSLGGGIASNGVAGEHGSLRCADKGRVIGLPGTIALRARADSRTSRRRPGRSRANPDNISVRR